MYVLKPRDGAMEAHAHSAPYQTYESALPMFSSELSKYLLMI